MLRLTAAVFCAAATLLAADDDLDSQMKSVIGAYAIVQQNAADPVTSEQAFYQGAIPGLLRRLDPHSVFFDPGQFEQLKRMESATQKGFGSVVSLLPGRVIVLQTLPGTPSAKAGLAPGDEIVAVNGYVINRLDLDQLTELLTESRQQQAQLDVRPPGSAGIKHLVLTPEEMQSPSVERAFFVGAGIGYIRVASFDEKTSGQLKEAIEKLGGDRLAGLVLDLRNNPGGLLTAALETCSLFLQPGSKIVTVRGRNVPETSEVVPSIATPYGFKLAILINEKTASASEIVSGAIAGPRPRHHHRAGQLRKRAGPKRLSAERRHRPGVDHRALLHAQRPIHPETAGRRAIRAGRRHGAPQCAEGIPHGQGPRGDGRRRHSAGHRGLSAGHQPPARGARCQRLLHQLRHRVSPRSQGHRRFRGHASNHGRVPRVSFGPQHSAGHRRMVRGAGVYPDNRLKTEIFNQAFGVERGDEVEAQRDPVILKALEVLGG